MCPDRALAPWEARSIAERQAHRLHALLRITEPPFPTEAIASLPRVAIHYLPARHLSGAISWRRGMWRILINSRDGRGRQRFSLGHELKHLIDHPQRKAIYRDSRFGTADAAAERAADYFAACLLMPRAWIKRCFYDEGFRDPAVLARRFGVSAPAMRYRFDQLGLLEPEVVR
ncbi:MAG: ImmA/IrrE family metallo-endopeptidase [Solirubrobacterales bacterium]